MVAILRTRYGRELVARWSNHAIRVSVNGGAEAVALSLADDTGLALTEWWDGRVVLVYQDAAGLPHRLWSSNGGKTWGT